MANRVQLIRHTAGSAALFLGLQGEITVDLTTSSVRVHDGVTLGGAELSRKDLSNVSLATASSYGKATLQEMLAFAGPRIIAAGTRCSFQQETAPLYWTRIVTAALDDSMFRTLTTTAWGAGYGGSASPILMDVVPVHSHGASASGTHAHPAGGLTATGGNHAHDYTPELKQGGAPSGTGTLAAGDTNEYANYTFTTANSGNLSITMGGNTGNNSANPSITVNNNTGSNWTPKYTNFILATKDAY